MSHPASVCHVWLAPVDVWRPRYASWLSETDRHRIGLLRRDCDRLRSSAATCVVRALAATVLDLTPDAVPLGRRACAVCEQPHGALSLPGTGWHCSVAHSGGWLAAAATALGPVGVDVEANRGGAGQWSRAAHPELTEHALSDWQAVQLWTRKEAVLKATGEGLTTDLGDVVVTVPPRPPRLLNHRRRPGLVAQLHDITTGADYLAGSVAILTGAPVEVVLRKFVRTDALLRRP